MLCSGLVLFLNVPVFLVQERHFIILNTPALFGPVSSHFLAVRDANSLSLPQRVAKALPHSQFRETGFMKRRWKDDKTVKTQPLSKVVFGEDMKPKKSS